jgi:hypothetical protein
VTTKERIKSEYDALIAGLDDGNERPAPERRQSRRSRRREKPAPREEKVAEVEPEDEAVSSQERQAPPEPPPAEDEVKTAPQPVTADSHASGPKPSNDGGQGEAPFGAGIL